MTRTAQRSAICSDRVDRAIERDILKVADLIDGADFGELLGLLAVTDIDLAPAQSHILAVWASIFREVPFDAKNRSILNGPIHCLTRHPPCQR
ncbi:hypothetical protein KNJ79_18350 [Sphingopyxis indica]|uniref:hypothetical protein n=1 Tax=Sphingopyxis indica TaxID=436663 RepID=UPI002939032E|nr:hypothetical protein [Sphingopyxis indica]WOF43068.1 hypothetical protein KNJ79_18350 [Sphingopyxis indica]